MDKEINIFKDTFRVCFELANICNFSTVHKKCPLSLLQKPVILSMKVVFNALATMKKYKYKGEICFHTYSEPLIDPRLFVFIERSLLACPEATIFLWTNGWYLTQTLLDELIEYGVKMIRVSCYSNKEYKRISEFKTAIDFKFELQKFLDYIEIYDSKEVNCDRPCFAPLGEIIITNEGLFSLCCRDWRRDYVFGNLYRKSFEDVLKNPEIRNAYNKLRIGNRFLPICKRCTRGAARAKLSNIEIKKFLSRVALDS